MQPWLAAGAIVVGAGALLAQLPPSGNLSESDRPFVQAEISRLEKLQPSAADQPAIAYQLARTWAYAKQWPEAIHALNALMPMHSGLDPARDPLFADLRGVREFEQIAAEVRASTPQVSRSTTAFQIAQGDQAPESLAYDAAAKKFYFGSLRKGTVLECSPAGDCRTFAQGLGTILGLKVHRGNLWLLNNSKGDSSLIQLNLASAHEVRRYVANGSGHQFNDLVFSPAGDIFLTDTPASTVWRLANGASELTKLPGSFAGANGIAISSDGSVLFVSTFPDGITLVDLKSGTSAPIRRPTDLSLVFIDGLYFYRGNLIAIQNGYMTPRVIRLELSRNLRVVERFEILERRNPLFNGITTGVIAGRNFFYMANVQDDRQSAFDPITILKMRL